MTHVKDNQFMIELKKKNGRILHVEYNLPNLLIFYIQYV